MFRRQANKKLSPIDVTLHNGNKSMLSKLGQLYKKLFPIDVIFAKGDNFIVVIILFLILQLIFRKLGIYVVIKLKSLHS